MRTLPLLTEKSKGEPTVLNLYVYTYKPDSFVVCIRQDWKETARAHMSHLNVLKIVTLAVC